MSEPLTREILRGLEWELKMHLNGGKKFSQRVIQNKEWEIWVRTVHTGRPRQLSERVIGYSTTVEEDLLTDGALDRFVDLYNKERGLG